ncbi:MAG: hypothetical protein K0S07_179 [Chlamydiales bacterium]|jgi:hypothetical protein|nr:hypothetical protein [Chlamydiales bacterium]
MNYLILFICCFYSALAPAKEIFVDSLPPLPLRDHSYRSPTARYIEYHSWNVIGSSLQQMGVSLIHRNFFDRIKEREEVGFIGYHGSTKEFMIYQDIIRLIVEEIALIPIREDFHFFRIPGDPAYCYESLKEWGNLGYNPNYFLCLNFAIYGNHFIPGSCSYYYFTSNGSANHLNYQPFLQPLFQEIGLDAAAMQTLFAIGQKHLNQKNGVIYQLFDLSHQSIDQPFYALADAQCLPFQWYYYEIKPFSKIVLDSSDFINHSQARLLLNNAHTLNPYSSLSIQRFNKLSLEENEAYWQEMRQAVRLLSFSEEKRSAFRQKLLQLWGIYE